MIVGDHGIDDDLAVMPFTQLLDRHGRARHLLRARHQRGAVLHRPAVILHMRDLDTARAQVERQRNHLRDPIDIGAVHHDVDGERNLQRVDIGGKRPLPYECALVPRDAIALSLVAVLNRNLHVIESGRRQADPTAAS